MKKFFKWFGIVFLVLFIVGMLSDKDIDDTDETIKRYNKQSSSVQACVKTLGEGVYSYKSLSWKLDSCNATK